MADSNSYLLAQQFFLQLLSFVYLFAFCSLLYQVGGLYGSKGILPIQEELKRQRSWQGRFFYLKVPTLFWLNASDRALVGVCLLGVLVSFLSLLGIAPWLFLPLLWILYLSFVSVGSTFLRFQWDTLLLETGFIAIFLAQQSPPLLLLWSLWLLLFRLMFSSGVVKILSGCPSWRSLRALCFHYETQPLPNRVAYYMHQLPLLCKRAAEVGVFFFELLVPFLIFGSTYMQIVASFLIILFQFFIFFTGNYAFFNLLTSALAVLLLPNFILEGSVAPAWIGSSLPLPSLFLNLMGAVLIGFNLLQLIMLFVPLNSLYRLLAPFSSFFISNGYGLFAWMTTTRDEIVIEGSLDGKIWKTYEFKWKPGHLAVPPRQVAPYHPRLDWQMWFAALTPYQTNPWFISFLERLLEGSKEVEQLLWVNPFKDKPPQFIRALLYTYHFSSIKTKRQTGQWWTRTLKGHYTPTFTSQLSQ